MVLVWVFNGSHLQLAFTQFTNGSASISSVAAGVLAAQPTEGTLGSTVTSESGAVTVNPDQPDVDGDYSILSEVLGSASGSSYWGFTRRYWVQLFKQLVQIQTLIF